LTIISSKLGQSRAVRAGMAALAAGGFALTALVATPGAALAATPHCNSEHYFQSTSGDFNVYAPAYHSGSSYTKVCTLSQGNSGDGVASLQVAMVQCYGSNISVDGQFGPATAVTLTVIQSVAKITADGIYGNNTRKAMKFPRADDNPNDTECGRLS
jgi:peptidoglycan hydrolase-like protein with peptidoglycan-binding domain